MRLKIQEFSTLTSSNSTAGGGVGFGGEDFFWLVVVAFFSGRYAQNRRPNSIVHALDNSGQIDA